MDNNKQVKMWFSFKNKFLLESPELKLMPKAKGKRPHFPGSFPDNLLTNGPSALILQKKLLA